MTLHSPSLAPDWKIPLLIRAGSTRSAWLRLRQGGEVVTKDCTAISTKVYKDTSASTLFSDSGALTPADTTEFPITPGDDLSLDWIARWSWTYGGVTYQDTQRVCVVGQLPVSRVALEDLYDEEPDLRHAARLPQGQADFTPQILSAYYDIIKRLTRRGKEPWKSIDPGDFYEWHKAKSLAKSCGAIPSAAGQHYYEAAARYRALADRLYHTLTIERDDSPGEHRAAGPSVVPLAPSDRRSS